jgi:hypothetical protein
MQWPWRWYTLAKEKDASDKLLSREFHGFEGAKLVWGEDHNNIKDAQPTSWSVRGRPPDPPKPGLLRDRLLSSATWSVGASRPHGSSIGWTTRCRCGRNGLPAPMPVYYPAPIYPSPNDWVITQRAWIIHICPEAALIRTAKCSWSCN